MYYTAPEGLVALGLIFYNLYHSLPLWSWILIGAWIYFNLGWRFSGHIHHLCITYYGHSTHENIPKWRLYTYGLLAYYIFGTKIGLSRFKTLMIFVWLPTVVITWFITPLGVALYILTWGHVAGRDDW